MAQAWDSAKSPGTWIHELVMALCAGTALGGAYLSSRLAPLLFLGWLLTLLALSSAARAHWRRTVLVGMIIALPWLAAQAWLHAFIKTPNRIAIVTSAPVGGFLALLFRPLFRRPGLSSALLLASLAGLIHLVLGWTPGATSIAPAAQLWAYPTLIQSCGLVGASGWMFLMTLAAAGTVFARVGASARNRRASLVLGLSAFMALGLGEFALGSGEEGSDVRVAAVQGCERAARVSPALEQLTRQAARQGAEMIVWPEVTLECSPLDDPQLGAFCANLARSTGAVLVIPFHDEKRNQNRLVVYERDGGVAGTYAKLCPAEWIGEDCQPGTDFPVHRTSAASIGACICYDAHFPRVATRLVHEGAALLVVTADSIFPELGRRYPPMVSVLRALENGVPVVWSDMLMGTRIVDATGQVIAEAACDDHLIIGSVRTVPRGSWHARTGGLLSWLLCAAGLVGSLGAWFVTCAPDRRG